MKKNIKKSGSSISGEGKLPYSPMFVTDGAGNKAYVMLTFENYENLLEDLADLNLMYERRNDPCISLDEVESLLKSNGKI